MALQGSLCSILLSTDFTVDVTHELQIASSLLGGAGQGKPVPFDQWPDQSKQRVRQVQSFRKVLVRCMSEHTEQFGNRAGLLVEHDHHLGRFLLRESCATHPCRRVGKTVPCHKSSFNRIETSLNLRTEVKLERECGGAFAKVVVRSVCTT